MSKCYSYRGAPIDVRLKSRVKIDPVSQCWNWIGCTNKFGYGIITIDKWVYTAHRTSWQTFNGEIPGDLFVLHKCDNPGCINPEHLFLGTQKDNAQDCIAKGRWPKLRRFTKITEHDVRAIRIAAGRHSDIGRRFGIHQTEVTRIKNRTRWGDLP